MSRPCEDVIFISDAEEGELMEDESEPESKSPSNQKSHTQSHRKWQPELVESDREEGELPDDELQLIEDPLPTKPHLEPIDSNSEAGKLSHHITDNIVICTMYYDIILYLISAILAFLSISQDILASRDRSCMLKVHIKICRLI